MHEHYTEAMLFISKFNMIYVTVQVHGTYM